MEKIIVAFESDQARSRICELLESGGYHPVLCCTGAEVIRTVKQMQGATIVCGYKLPDMTADALSHTLEAAAVILVVARPAQLEFCEGERIFKLPMPITKGEFLASLRMLAQIGGKLLYMPKKQRGAESRALIEHAKEILMANNHMTEEQAHRFIQKKSMDTGAKLEETAQLIINAH